MFPSHAAITRTTPFAVYLLFLALAQGLVWGGETIFLEGEGRWLYPLKILCVTLALIALWRHFSELRVPSRASDHRIWYWASVGGVAIFWAWIHLDNGLWTLGLGSGFDPRDLVTGKMDWPLALSRLAGAALVVPIMEELFWRSFVLRWLQSPRFMEISPRQVGGRAIMLSSLAFGLEHTEWAAGVLAGMVYAWLYVRSGDLWVSVYAHGVTNLILGLWVLYGGHWGFW